MRNYRGKLDPLQLYASVVTALLICTTSAASGPFQSPFRRYRPTYYGPTEALDPQYTPSMQVAEKYRDHFLPTMVTDASGGLAPELTEDLA